VSKAYYVCTGINQGGRPKCEQELPSKDRYPDPHENEKKFVNTLVWMQDEIALLASNDEHAKNFW
jgi:hypothetical protein